MTVYILLNDRYDVRVRLLSEVQAIVDNTTHQQYTITNLFGKTNELIVCRI